MQKIPGKQIADKIIEDLKAEVTSKNLHPKLAVLLVGNDPASELYVSLKLKAAERIGITTDVQKLPAQTSDDELIKLIENWNNDPGVSGILIQLPLPDDHDTDRVIAAMDPKKDADGFHPQNISSLTNGQATILSPLHEGILRLLAATGIVPKDSLIAIVANSHTFADPLEYILKKAGATVNVMLADQKNDKELRDADAIVVAVGKPNFLTSNCVRNGSVIIDVGINKTPDNKVCGDFDFQACESLEGFYSPVPGGVGPMTVALLMKNVITLAAKE